MRDTSNLKPRNMCRASQIIGEKVVNGEREDLGKIEDVVLDMNDNRIAYAVLSFGGFLGMGDKYFAIPWTAFEHDLDDECFILDIPRDRLQNAPGFPKDRWPDLAMEPFGTEIQEYYETVFRR
jgi:sporulation protein YlmC with PRC-barrel domain